MKPSKSRAETEGIVVEVFSRWEQDHSDVPNSRWLFSYRVTIRNEGDESARLVDRHWIIEDGRGRREEVRGPGVVGEQPLLHPGDSHTYVSGCPLRTSFGTMKGTFGMERPDGGSFRAEIPEFLLAVPTAIN